MCVICNIQLGLRVIVRATVEGVWEITEVCIEGDHMGRRVSLSNFYRKRGKNSPEALGEMCCVTHAVGVERRVLEEDC